MSTYKLGNAIFRRFPVFIKKSEVIRVDDRDDLDWIQGKGRKSIILKIIIPRNFRFPYTYFSLKKRFISGVQRFLGEFNDQNCG